MTLIIFFLRGNFLYFAQDCCDFGIGSQTLLRHGWVSSIFSVLISDLDLLNQDSDSAILQNPGLSFAESGSCSPDSNPNSDLEEGF
jgi:hypothetical protein